LIPTSFFFLFFRQYLQLILDIKQATFTTQTGGAQDLFKMHRHLRKLLPFCKWFFNNFFIFLKHRAF